MNWKCFFGHDWKIECTSPHPYSSSTFFLSLCEKCKKIKTQEVRGYFKLSGERRGDDDADDRDKDREPTPEPKMSPDEYFDLITKE